MLNPKTIKACLSETSLSFIPHLSSDPLLLVAQLFQSRSTAPLGCVFPNLSLSSSSSSSSTSSSSSSLSPTPTPFSPVLGPLCHGNPLFPLRPVTHAPTHEHRWSESVYLRSLIIQRWQSFVGPLSDKIGKWAGRHHWRDNTCIYLTSCITVEVSLTSISHSNFDWKVTKSLIQLTVFVVNSAWIGAKKTKADLPRSVGAPGTRRVISPSALWSTGPNQHGSNVWKAAF